MQIIFTDKCKKNIIYSEGGIKLNLNGYAFYDANLSSTDIKTLTLDDIKLDKIICSVVCCLWMPLLYILLDLILASYFANFFAHFVALV